MSTSTICKCMMISIRKIDSKFVDCVLELRLVFCLCVQDVNWAIGIQSLQNVDWAIGIQPFSMTWTEQSVFQVDLVFELLKLELKCNWYPSYASDNWIEMWSVSKLWTIDGFWVVSIQAMSDRWTLTIILRWISLDILYISLCIL